MSHPIVAKARYVYPSGARSLCVFLEESSDPPNILVSTSGRIIAACKLNRAIFGRRMDPWGKDPDEEQLVVLDSNRRRIGAVDMYGLPHVNDEPIPFLIEVRPERRHNRNDAYWVVQRGTEWFTERKTFVEVRQRDPHRYYRYSSLYTDFTLTRACAPVVAILLATRQFRKK